jgi:hypothetical protein
LAVEAVRKYPDRFAIMGWFYLDDPNGRDRERPASLEHCAAQWGAKCTVPDFLRSKARAAAGDL